VTLVRVRLVVLNQASGVDMLIGEPPASKWRFGPSPQSADRTGVQPVRGRVWATQVMPFNNLTGLSSVFTDLQYFTPSLNCGPVTAAPLFSQGASGVCQDAVGLVNEVGGRATAPDLGVAPMWYRIATVSMSASAKSVGNVISSADADGPIAIAEPRCRGSVEYAKTPEFQIGSMYDLDGNCMIEARDLGMLQRCLGHDPS